MTAADAVDKVTRMLESRFPEDYVGAHPRFAGSLEADGSLKGIGHVAVAGDAECVRVTFRLDEQPELVREYLVAVDDVALHPEEVLRTNFLFALVRLRERLQQRQSGDSV
jgi:hypothetical protein